MACCYVFLEKFLDSAGCQAVGKFIGVSVEPIDAKLLGRKLFIDREQIEVWDFDLTPECVQFLVREAEWIGLV